MYMIICSDFAPKVSLKSVCFSFFSSSFLYSSLASSLLFVFLFSRGSVLAPKLQNHKKLCVFIFIYIRQLSSFRVPTLWFIDLTVTACHIRYTFPSLCQFLSGENGQKTKILEVCHFRMIQKWLPTVTRRAKH